MKRFNVVFIGGLMINALVLGQAQQTQTGNTANIPAPTPYAIVSQDGNSQVWERTTYELSPSGQAIPHLHHYTELATGLNFKDPTTGQWVPSQEAINILPDGSAAATNGQHQAYFPADIYNGTITLVTPDGLQLQSQPTGLFYDDGSNTVMIAELTNSVGQLISPNQVIYTNAFTGLDADLLYTYTKAGFEQDVILNKQPQNPEFYGLNSQTAQLQILTEFFNPPQPALTTTQLPGQAGVALPDSTLDFGAMEMVLGRAFLLGAGADDAQVLVGKQWLSVGGRQFLVEAVPVAAIGDQLSQLPAAQTSSIKPNSPMNVVSAKRLLPPQRLVKAVKTHPMWITQTGISTKGLLLDYQTINSSQTNVTFRGDTSYYISGAVVLFGTNTFEGGTVIKYTNNAYITTEPVGPHTIVWQASAYRPVIFTAKDDNTVGDAISGSTGNPTGYYAEYALLLSSLSGSAPTISYFRIAYAQQAIDVVGSTIPKFYNGQIVNCENGFSMNGGSTAYLRNILFANVNTPFNNIVNTIFDVQNATFSFNTNLVTSQYNPVTPEYLYFTNCVFANVLNLFTNSQPGPPVTCQIIGNGNGFYNAPTFGTNQTTNTFYPFQTVGAGSYYLTNGCDFRTHGTVNIDTNLLADLVQKTTYPPVVYTGTNIYTLGTLSPDVTRDTNTEPDLGYHYDPLDYVFAGCNLSNSLTFTAGTAVGWYEADGTLFVAPCAICLNDGGSLSFSGDATEPDYFVRYAMVQEGGNSNWANVGVGGIWFNGSGQMPLPQLSGFFTKWTTDGRIKIFSGDSAYGQAGFLNCEFYDAWVSSLLPTIAFTNCLFFRDFTTFSDAYTNDGFVLDNCTFYNGGVLMDRGISPPSFWQIENSSFDGTCFTWGDYWSGTNYTLFNHNAYNTNNFNWKNYAYFIPPTNGTLEVIGPEDVMVTNYNWENSSFGSFYLPTNSPLLQQGSTNANFLGLYWFTTQTNQTINGANLVDIGYHYVATDTNGNPLETFGTNVPNYILYPDPLPEILTNPASQTVVQGSNVIFNVTATGIPPLNYQWFWDGTPLSDEGGVSGSANAILNLNFVNLTQAGSYQVVVSNNFGSVTSDAAVLTIQTNAYDTPGLIMATNAYWNVTDISDPAQPVNIGFLQEPFSEPRYGLPFNAPWHTNTVITVTNAYGIATYGGSNGMGTVFQIGLINSGFTVVHTFSGDDGAYPCSQLAISGSSYYDIPNTVYGTTAGGGADGYGTVFKVNTDGTGFTNLYEFTGANDGKYPETGLLIFGNVLYGTTTNSIFKINTDGSDFTCLTNINGASQLILSPAGNIAYGTTYSGGASNEGMLFSISTEGTNLIDLHDFTGGTNGAYPDSGLELYGISNYFGGSNIFNLFGTAFAGGSNDYGMVFSISNNGSGFRDLHNFNYTNDGANPVGGLLVTNNNFLGPTATYLFGTTSTGGTNGGGTVFGMSLNGASFQTLYSFGGAATNGTHPAGKLVLDYGTLYGATSGGGVYTNGMVFGISNNGSSFIDLHDFNGTNDGGSPLAGFALPVVDNLASIWSLDIALDVPANLTNNISYNVTIDDTYALIVNGNLVKGFVNIGGAHWLGYLPLSGLQPGGNDIRLIISGNDDGNDYFALVVTSTVPITGTNLLGYGTAWDGGTSGNGTIFAISPGGSEVNLHTFTNGPDGEDPIGDLVLSNNTLYGVTQFGGTNNYGAIYSISTNGLNYQMLYNFTSTPDGGNPLAGLIMSGNTLYGTTENGGTNGQGCVFSIGTNGSNYRILYSFDNTANNDGENPKAPLLLVSNVLFGTTYSGGANNSGTIFSISTNGVGYTNLYNFGSTSYDGVSPIGQILIESNTLYGTTYFGGTDNYGTIFGFTIGSTNDVMLYSFSGPSVDGQFPQAGLTLVGNTLYGMTKNGGANNLGTMFSIGINGSGYINVLSLGSSNSDYGSYPITDLMLRSNSLYGTIYQGGPDGLGMVFSISTNGTDFKDIYDFTGSGGANPEGGLCFP